MTQYDNSYSGSISKNANKEPGDKRPDYKGSINIGGVAHWLSGWVRKDQEGNTFLSLKAEPKEERQGKPVKAPSKQTSDEDVPF